MSLRHALDASCVARSPARGGVLYTGQMRMVGGKLQTTSIDVYLALEHCEAGDLHALQGQMSTSEVRDALMQQCLHEHGG